MDQTELYLILKQIADGDKLAFNHFYDVTISRTFGLIMRITSSKQLAEEVASDVYMQVCPADSLLSTNTKRTLRCFL